MEILLGYLAGILTFLNPCVLPVLPIALASALHKDRYGPIWLTLGMSITFVGLGIFIAAVGVSIGLNEDTMSKVAAVLMMAFGAILLVPLLGERFALASSGLSANADMAMASSQRSTTFNQLIGGALLGAVWSPCIGPTLGGAISLASQGSNLIWAGAIMTSFAAGISTVILALAYGAREAILRRQATMRRIAQRAKPVMGIAFLTIGVLIFFSWHHLIEAWLLDMMPYWLQDLSVII